MEKREHQNSPGSSFVPGKPSILPSVVHALECIGVWGAFQYCACLQMRWEGCGEDGREYGANVLQPEPQNCDPPRRALLEEKKKKEKKSNGFSGILFSVHI